MSTFDSARLTITNKTIENFTDFFFFLYYLSPVSFFHACRRVLLKLSFSLCVPFVETCALFALIILIHRPGRLVLPSVKICI